MEKGVLVDDGFLAIAQPPIEASPAKVLAQDLSRPVTVNGNNSRVEGSVLGVERRSRDGLSWDYLPVPLNSDEPALVEELWSHLLPRVRPSWSREGLRPRVFEDGVSNKLVGFFQEGAAEETAVLVRVNGEGREMMTDGETEVLVMLTLHRAGLSPPLYLVARNAICYGYIPGRALTSSEMQCEGVLEATSRALAQFHSIPPPASLQGTGPWVWNQVEKWMGFVRDSFNNDSVPHKFKQVFGSVEEVRQEMEWLKSVLRAPSSPRIRNDVSPTASETTADETDCVLCHNDPQPLNFVLRPDGNVVLIDMEYSGVNYPAFDVGTFFCEFAGVHGTVDHSRYPSEVFQKRWITKYLHERAAIKGVGPTTVTAEHVDQLYKDANHFAIVAHFLWSLWSLIQYRNSSIAFDYLQYGCERYTEYKRRRALILGLK